MPSGPKGKGKFGADALFRVGSYSDVVVQFVNLKSQNKPFTILEKENNKVLQKKKDYRIGRRSGLNREDLIIWIEYEFLSTSRIHISR